MQRNLDKSAEFTAGREGLYQNLHSDPGNWTRGEVGMGRQVGTMRGISAPVMVQWCGSAELVTAAVMKSISQTTFEAIYAALYWRAIAGDNLPDGVDLMLVDFAFNSGVQRAAKQFQQIVGVLDSEIDGNIGPETLAIMENVRGDQIAKFISKDYAARLQTDLAVTADGAIGPVTLRAAQEQDAGTRLLIYALASRQALAYRSFSNFRNFGSGWLARLEARLVRALAMLEARPLPAMA